MKRIAILMLATALAGCAAPAPRSVGFTGIGGEPAATVPDDRVVYLSAPSSSAPRAAASRVPSYATPSANVRRGRAPIASPQLAALQAMAYMSHDWGSGASVAIAAGDSRGRLRLVTVDGHSFAVVGKIDQPAFREARDTALARMMASTVEATTGCTTLGPVSFAKGKYGTVSRMAYHVSC